MSDLVVSGPLLPWQPRPGETAEDRILFWAWVEGLAEPDPELAAKYQWTERRAQLDGMAQLPDDNPAMKAAQSVMNALDVVAISSRQHLLDALESPERAKAAVSLKDGVEIVMRAANVEMPTRESQFDWSKAPPDMQQKYLELSKYVEENS